MSSESTYIINPQPPPYTKNSPLLYIHPTQVRSISQNKARRNPSPKTPASPALVDNLFSFSHPTHLTSAYIPASLRLLSKLRLPTRLLSHLRPFHLKGSKQRVSYFSLYRSSSGVSNGGDCSRKYSDLNLPTAADRVCRIVGR